MAFSDGDFVEIEYSAYDSADGKIIETTDEKAARDAGIYDKHMHYGRRLIIFGFSRVINGLDRELRRMSVGQHEKFTFGPDDAFGKRNEDYIRVMRLSDMREMGVDPHPGMRVNLDGMVATVRNVASGRVTVDMNHPYAGHDIKYEIKIVGNPKSDAERIKALGQAYDVEPSEAQLQDSTVLLKYGPDKKKDEAYYVDKAALIRAVFETMKGVSNINVEEQYRREEKKEEATKQVAATSS